MMTAESLALTEKQFPQMRNPLGENPPFTILIELSDHESEAHARTLVEAILAEALELGIATNAVIANSLAQANTFWQMREHITLAQAQEGANLKHDITIPLSALEDFITTTDQVLREKYPQVRIINFGHLGDGNLHYNVAAPAGVDSATFNAANETRVHDIIYSMVEKFGGSISAEHGIGQLKMRDLRAHKGAIAHNLMQLIKTALDPHNILNPNKVLPAKVN
jgi:FAD/FMN-containing dehydrogenase